MDKYLRDYEEYVEEYDRETIRQLKELEEDLSSEQKKAEMGELQDTESNAYQLFLTMGLRRVKGKSDSISRRMAYDQKMDDLVANTPKPVVRCKICGKVMDYADHTFRNDGREILFFFSCPMGHLPKRLVYPDGKREITFKPKQCKGCGGLVVSTNEESEYQLVLIDTCQQCGHNERMEMEMAKPEPIDEQERKKYCTDFIGKKTRLDNLSGILSVIADMENNPKKRKTPDADVIEKVTIPEIEARITASVEKSGFTKLNFQVPQLNDQVIIEFTLQDPVRKDEAKSIRLFRKEITTLVNETNWRLAPGTNYRMGLITGKIIGYDKKEDIAKLAKQANRSNKKKS